MINVEVDEYNPKSNKVSFTVRNNWDFIEARGGCTERVWDYLQGLVERGFKIRYHNRVEGKDQLKERLGID